jgi:hypothetical protein
MNQQRQAEVTPASNALRLKLSGRLGRLEPVCLAEARPAMEDLAKNFDRMIHDELSKLDTVRERIQVEGYDGETAQILSIRVNDLKRLGEAYGYPLVVSVAGSMRCVIDHPSTRLRDPLLILDAHIDCLREAMRSNIRGVDNTAASGLLSDLERCVLTHYA